MRVAIATSQSQLPPSDEALADALRQRGVRATAAIWSETGVDWRAFDAVLVRSCWDYHLRTAEFLSWIAHVEAAGIRMMNDPVLLRWNANKQYLRALERGGIPIPETVWVGPNEGVDVGEVCTERGWRQAVVKPLVSASAYRTELRTSGIVNGPVMVQEYLAAIQNEGEWSLMWFDHAFSHAVRKRPQEGDFRVQKEYGGTAHAATPDAALIGFASSVLERLPTRAVWARVDLLRDRGRLLLMELEILEPELFLDASEGADHRLAEVVMLRTSEEKRV